MSFSRRIIMGICLIGAIVFGSLLRDLPLSAKYWAIVVISVLFTIAILLGVDTISRPKPHQVKLPHPISYDKTPFTMDSHKLVIASYDEESDFTHITPEQATQKATLTMLRALYQQQYEIEEQRQWERNQQ